MSPNPAVLLPSSHHASRSSTPGISSLDGTPPYLYPCPPPHPHPTPPRLRSVPQDPDMTVKPSPVLRPGRLDHHEWLKADLITNDQVLFPPTMRQKHPSPEASPARTAVPDEERRPTISLPDLSQLLRLQKYQKRRSHQAKERLHYLQIAAARTSRLARDARSVQHTLAECIRSEDKPSFANLLHAFQDACDLSLKPTSRAIVENESDTATDIAPAVSFLEDLSPSSRTSILDLLGKIRYSNTFLADHLASLTHKELLNLLPDRSAPKSSESIFGNHSGLRSRTSRPLGFVVDAQVDSLSSFTYNSPLEALIFATQGVNTNGPSEDSRSMKIWATVCAKLISEQKPGSEKLVPAILDIWTSMLPWPGKTRLEVWILQTLQRGAFLLEHPSKQSFRARVEGRSDISNDEELRAEQFYTQAANSLLVLLSESTGPSVLPPGALKLCEALTDCLSDSLRHQKALPHFVVTRWLFTAFIMDAVTSPETHGMLADHYVSEISRQRILREVASRAQKAVFDVAYSWKTGTVVSYETTQSVNAVMARFKTFPSNSRPPYSTPATRFSRNEPDNFVVLSAKDVLTFLNLLFPQRRPASVSSDGENVTSGLMSSSTSVSGFSLFRHCSETEMFAQSTESITRGVECLPLSHAEADRDALDASHMREVYLELEDLVSSHSTAGGSLWDVLYARTGTHHLEMMRDAIKDHQRFDDHVEALTPCSRRSMSEDQFLQMMSCAKAVESLLREHESRSSLLTEDEYGDETPYAAQSALKQLFEQSIDECEASSDFVQAHHWYQRLRDFENYMACSHDSMAISNLLEHIEHTVRGSLYRTESSLDACGSWTRHLNTASQIRRTRLDPILDEHERLRDKLWYVADVRTSAAFEEARSVAAALRVMGKTKRLPRARMQPPLRHWNGLKLSGSSKTEAQILEILSARPEHGGPNKLSDDQSRAIELWMDRQNVDNICKGEERLHKLCMEVRKCVDSIIGAPNESSTIWSNALFAQDKAIRAQMPPQKKSTLLQGPLFGTGQHNYLSLQTHLRSNDALSSTSRTLSSVSSREFLDTRSPTLTNKSSVPFWSPVMTEVDSTSSATSVDFSRAQSAFDLSSRKPVRSAEVASEMKLDALRQRALSLVLSDLTSVLFSDGSETDRSFWTGLGWTLTDRYFRGMQALHSSIGSPTPTMTSASALQPSTSHFKFEAAFSTLLQKFSATSNPHTKLVCLYDIDRLLVPYMTERDAVDSPMASFMRSAESTPLTTMSKTQDTADISVRGFRSIFTKNTLRPPTIFRDLQYIAALLPASVLQNTPEGKAFCNAAVAISGLKQEARSIMVETADGIIAYHSNNRGHGRASSTAQQQRDSATFAAPSRTPSAEDVSRYSMADAAYLLQIAAKEGDHIAQRELATLYLTHPELMDPIIAPLARPRDVFKDELESKWRKNQDPNRCDPATMCVAHHWMSLSSKGGDSLAKEYLRQREEMDGF